MFPSVNRSRPAIALACVLGLALGACSKSADPTSWSATSPATRASATASIDGDRAASAAPPRASDISWNCFAAGGCTPSRITLLTVQAAPIITAAPTSLQRFVQGSTVSLGWVPPAGSAPTSYVIEAGTSPGASNITTFDTGNTNTGILINNVPNGTYYVRVRGRDAAGTGPASNEVVIVVGGTPGPPPPSACAVSGLQAVAIGSSVAVRWNRPSGCGVDGYTLGIGNAPGVANLAAVSVLDESYAVEGVPPGTYYLVVRARSGANVYPLSNVASVLVTGVAPPGTSVFTGLVANGDGVETLDVDCGPMKLDLTATLVQTGATVSGFTTIVIRAAANCQDAIGFTNTGQISGTATGSLADGSGSFTAIAGSGSDAGTVNATFANGRMTGTLTFPDGNGTFRINKR